MCLLSELDTKLCEIFPDRGKIFTNDRNDILKMCRYGSHVCTLISNGFDTLPMDLHKQWDYNLISKLAAVVYQVASSEFPTFHKGSFPLIAKANSQARCENFHPITIFESTRCELGFCDMWKKRLNSGTLSLPLPKCMKELEQTFCCKLHRNCDSERCCLKCIPIVDNCEQCGQ